MRTPDGDILGDHYNCECPCCGKINHAIAQGVRLELNKVIIFSKPCFHCKENVFYRGEYVIKITASTEHPIDRLKS